MKKLRKISLENFDRLSSSEASRLIGGKDKNPTIPPPKPPTNTNTKLPSPHLGPFTGQVQPGGYSLEYNGGNYKIGGSVSGGGGSGAIKGTIYF